jgi:hypothetical protein
LRLARVSRALASTGRPPRTSVVEDRQVEAAEAFGVGKYVDFDDLAARDGEAQDRAAGDPTTERGGAITS